ncbi:BCS1 N terminal-domain-containing protein [Bombardia bombarda]|uniref:BCS1 N terminal-domain-containing protein n=1 Tax=Bombardia bombarda TaxID=252184 RepID=A0AA40CEE4_9PEZI|nr:BCS1 N terminal-domain-containing protein [Bombardia bombarda]
MELVDHAQGLLPTLAANVTDTISNGTDPDSSFSSPHGVMEGLLLFFGAQFPLMAIFVLFHDKFGSYLGIDLTIPFILCGFIWVTIKIMSYLYEAVEDLVKTHLMAKVSIDNSDALFLQLTEWLAWQPIMANSRSVTVETPYDRDWDEESALEAPHPEIAPDGAGITLNFSMQEARIPSRYTPAIGSTQNFWHNGTFFRLIRSQNTVGLRNKEIIVISCFGWSPEPVKKLLQHAKEEFYAKNDAKTTISRPKMYESKKFRWERVAVRLVRPLKTVVLDDSYKVRVLSDMHEYLHAATPRWYANRGIPLRRGYLFYGPPGTGKTSLSFALAGAFGLAIYIISLQDPKLTEEDLSFLFSKLPRRCIILLEDIDTAGLTRRPDSSSLEDGKPKDSEDSDKDGDVDIPPSKEGAAVADLAKALKKEFSKSADVSTPGKKKEGITLSGLLNAIDGVSSHEGRVLIMTTNKPDALDEALIRPGRVDLKIPFTNATRDQAKELFVRMYELDTKAAGLLPSSPPSSPPPSITAGSEILPANNTPQPLTIDELSHIAAEFSSKIPDNQIISSAEIQGFLLMRKKNPREAVEQVGEWVESLIKQKESRSKVSDGK